MTHDERITEELLFVGMLGDRMGQPAALAYVRRAAADVQHPARRDAARLLQRMMSTTDTPRAKAMREAATAEVHQRINRAEAAQLRQPVRR